MNVLLFEVSEFHKLYTLEASQDTSGLAGTYCKTEHVRQRNHLKVPVYMKQSPVMYFQMSKVGNWIVSAHLDGTDIKLEQESAHLDPASLSLHWKGNIPGLRVEGSDYDIGPCSWYKKRGTTNGAVHFEDITSTTKPICSRLNCEQNEGTERNFQEEEKEFLDYTPIYIGGGLAVVIVTIGCCLGFNPLKVGGSDQR